MMVLGDIVCCGGEGCGCGSCLGIDDGLGGIVVGVGVGML